MKSCIRQNKAITLIALVITIIVILILAGVTIASLTGENGLLTRAVSSKEKSEEAEVKEQLQLSVLSALTKGNGKIEDENVRNEIINSIKQAKNEDITGDENLGWQLKLNDSIYYVSPEGKSKKIEDRTGLKVGDYINYTYDSEEERYFLDGDVSGLTNNGNYYEYETTPTFVDLNIYRTDTDLKWRILSINLDGSIDLVSEGIGSKGAIIFMGSRGYNNAVYVLNDIAKTFYSNSKLKDKSTVRSINLDDIEKHFTKISEKTTDEEKKETGEYAKNNNVYVSGSYRFPIFTQQTMSGTQYYPKLYEQEKHNGVTKNGNKGRSESVYLSPTTTDNYVELTSGLNVTHTYYGFNNIPTSYIQNKVYTDQADNIGQNVDTAYNLLFGTESTFWLASRTLYCTSPSQCYFGLNFVTKDTLYGNWFFRSLGRANMSGYQLRPIVSLDSSVIILTDNDGLSAENARTIVGL